MKPRPLRLTEPEQRKLVREFRRTIIELRERRNKGWLLSNICFNCSQDSRPFGESERKQMREQTRAWDGITRAVDLELIEMFLAQKTKRIRSSPKGQRVDKRAQRKNS